MKKRLLISGLLFLSCLTYAQIKEVVTENGVNNNITITTNSSYKGTSSDKARKYFDKAYNYEMQKDFQNAEKYYLKAIKKDDQYIKAYDNLGLTYRRLKKYEKAIEYYKKSIAIYPEGITAHQNLAAVYGIKGQNEKAIQEYQTIIKLQPQNPEGYFGLANAYMMLKKFDKALTNGHKALNLYEKNKSHYISDGYHLLGLIYFYKKDTDNAKKYLKIAKEKGARINPKIDEYLFQEEGNPFQTEEDYAKYEQNIVDGYHWLMNTPLGTHPQKRKETSAFMLQWMTGNPKISLEISEKTLTFSDCPDCLMIFLSGWTNYCITHQDFNNKLKGSLAGLQSVIEFYKKNKKTIGENKAIEKLIELDNQNKLEQHLKSNL